MNAKTQDKIAKVFLWFIGFLLIAILAAFLGYMLYKGLPVLSPKFIFGMPSGTRKAKPNRILIKRQGWFMAMLTRRIAVQDRKHGKTWSI